MKKNSVSADDKKFREAQSATYKKANWAKVIKLTARGGGAGRMSKRGS